MKTPVTIAFIGALTLSGCMDVESCDPNRVSNVISSAMCNDHFKTRQDNLGTNAATIAREVERERIAISRANTRIRSLQAQQKLSAGEVSAINREINALNNDVNRLSRTSNPQQSAELRARIKKRKAAINGLANAVVI